MVHHDGLAIGASSSGLIAENFLQHIEHSHLTLDTKIFTNYCRYVDDIVILFDPSHSIIHEIINDFNSLHLKVRFMAETEDDYILNYLQLSICRTPTGLRTAIFRKTHIYGHHHNFHLQPPHAILICYRQIPVQQA